MVLTPSSPAGGCLPVCQQRGQWAFHWPGRIGGSLGYRCYSLRVERECGRGSRERGVPSRSCQVAPPSRSPPLCWRMLCSCCLRMRHEEAGRCGSIGLRSELGSCPAVLCFQSSSDQYTPAAQAVVAAALSCHCAGSNSSSPGLESSPQLQMPRALQEKLENHGQVLAPWSLCDSWAEAQTHTHMWRHVCEEAI